MPLLPVRLLRDRNRAGANLIMLCVGTAFLAMFFFLTLFVQSVWGYSALKTGVAYLPLTAAIIAASGVAAQFVPRVGASALLLAGSAVSAGGLYWLSRLTEHSGYAGGMLGPMLVLGVGFGLLFVPLNLVGLHRVREKESGIASSLLNAGQQVGGSIGLAVLGTVAWTVVANSVHAQTAHTSAANAQPGGPAGPSQEVFTAIYDHALATGFSRGFLVAAGLALVIAIAAIRVPRTDLTGNN